MASKRSPQTREDVIELDARRNQHQPAVSHALKIKLDHLKTFEPLTDNQKLFFDMYKGGGYFIGLFGSPGVGKCQGEDVEVNLMVSEEMYEKLMSMQSS